MSEFEQTQDLREWFLRVAYDLGMTRRARIVSLEEIAGEGQNYMDPSPPAFVDRLDEIAVDLGERELIKSQAAGYGLLSITSKVLTRWKATTNRMNPAFPTSSTSPATTTVASSAPTTLQN